MEKNESITSEQRHGMIEEIIKTEWDMFQHVNNIGGRASCQDDWETFHIMRTSQYENWTDDLLIHISGIPSKIRKRREKSGGRKVWPHDEIHRTGLF